MHRFASPHTSSLATSMLREIDQISDKTLPRAIAAMLFAEGVTADDFYAMGGRFRGVSYNQVWVAEALRGLESGELDLAACLRGAEKIRTVLDQAGVLAARRKGRYGR